METKGKLTLWVEKERKLRKNFLLIYQSAIQLSGYHLAYQSISVTSFEHLDFFSLGWITIHNILLSINCFLLWKNEISINTAAWIFIIVNTATNTSLFCFNDAPLVFLLIGLNHHLIFPLAMSMVFETQVKHVAAHQLFSLLFVLFYLLYMIGGIFENSSSIWVITSLEYTLLRNTLYNQLTFLLVPRMIQIYVSYKREQLLKELNREKELESEGKERFFACMSHEMRNPLHALISTLDLMSNTDKSELDPRIVKSGKFSGELLLTLIGNILDFSKLQANKMESHMSSIDLREKVANILTMFESRAKAANLFLSANFDPNLPPAVETDGQKLNQVLINLIGNAIKFTSNGGITVNIEWTELTNMALDQATIKDYLEEAFLLSSREHFYNLVDEEIAGQPLNHNISDLQNRNIMRDQPVRQTLHFTGRITSHRKSRSVLSWTNTPRMSDYLEDIEGEFEQLEKHFGICKIEIIDSGIGLTKSQSEKLFQPFIQANASTSQNYGGTGLGLWISRSQIRLLGGDIKIESEKDMGSNFMIGLPMESGKEKPAIEKNEDQLWTRSKGDYKGKTCIYVDDQDCNLEVLSPLLKYLGFKCTSTCNGLTALQLLESHGPESCSLLITDLRMPKMSGQTFIAELRTLERTRKVSKIPIIVLTGEPSENEKNICKNILGVDEYLNKPASFNRLTEAIHRILDRKADQVKNINSDVIHNKAILIIDDDKFCSFLTKQFLSNMNTVIHQAYTLQTGLKKYEELKSSIGCILMDNSLPDGTGNIGAQQIRSFEKTNHLPSVTIISASGNSVESQKKSFSEKHLISAYLQKPFTKEVLLSKLLLQSWAQSS